MVVGVLRNSLILEKFPWSKENVQEAWRSFERLRVVLRISEMVQGVHRSCEKLGEVSSHLKKLPTALKTP